MKEKDFERLDQLLQKYYDGVESDGEFEDMILLLDETDLPYEYHSVRDTIMAAISGAGPDSADKACIQRIELQFKKRIGSRKDFTIKHIYYYIGGIAATIALLLSLWFLNPSESFPEDSYDDPALAYLETVKALNAISSNMSRGTDLLVAMEPAARIEEGMRSINTAGRLFGRGVEILSSATEAGRGKKENRKND